MLIEHEIQIICGNCHKTMECDDFQFDPDNVGWSIARAVCRPCGRAVYIRSRR
jgi:hypothetical protein